MSLSAQVTLDWADGDYTFTLGLAEIEELQRLCKAGFGEIVSRVFAGQFFITDIYATIRLGLIGGGTNPTRAKELMETYVYGKPLEPENDPSGPTALATAILAAVMNGVEPVGEPKAGATDVDTSTSPPSEQPLSNAESAPVTSTE